MSLRLCLVVCLITTPCLGAEKQEDARPQIEALFMPRPVLQVNERAELIVQVANPGDAPVGGSRLRFKSMAVATTQGSQTQTTEPTATQPAFEIMAGGKPVEETVVRQLAPGESARMVFDIVGKLRGNVDISVEWIGQGFSASRSRRTVCVDKADPRELCTGPGGMWRFMPKPMPLQEGTSEPLTPLATKKSAELPDSFIGVSAHLPRSRDFEVVFEPAHLIDGKYDTSWSSRAHATAVPGATDWVEVYFGAPVKLKEVRLMPYWRAEGFPADFDVKIRSRGSWKTVREVRRVHLAPSAGEGKKEPFSVKFKAPQTADAVCVEASRFTPASSFFTDCAPTCYFRLSEIEAIDPKGKNVAAADANVEVKASSTFRSYYSSTEVIRETYDELYDLGVKWNRVGQWGDWTCWAIVEQKKGEYFMDPATDEAITESIRNGVNILYTLDYGNALYEETPRLADPGPVWRHGHPFSGDGGPTKPEAIQGFVNYAKFVANHFRGRVRHYEIWNEPNSWAWYGAPPDPKAFGVLLRETAKALKEIDPEIKVMVGGTAALAPTFISQALGEGGGQYLDAIAFHPYTMPYPEMGLGSLDVIDGKQVGKSKEELGYKTCREMLAFLRKTFEPFNPKFEFWANEWNAIPTREDSPYNGGTEIIEAKQAARFFLMSTLTRVRGVWWSLANDNTIYDWAILRSGDFSRKPVYYTIQAMCTLLSGAKPDPTIKAVATGDAPELQCEALRGRDGEILVAVWSAVNPEDDYAGRRITLRVAGASGKSVDAVDTFHALVQKLDFRADGDDLVIEGLLVMDYPIVVRLR